MGIHISVRKVTGKTMEETWSGKTVPYYTTEKQDWFDFIRHTGDSDFVLENDFVFVDSDAEVEEQELARPADFNKCREWVKTNVFEGNQPRLLEALDRLEQDESLVFTWSW